MAPNFVIDTNPAVDWPVKVKLPRGGNFVAFGFNANIKLMAEADYAALLESAAQTSTDQDKAVTERGLAEVLASNARILPQVVLGWDVTDSDGAAVPIDSLPQMLVGPYGRAISVALYHAINEIRYGVKIDETPGANEGN